MASVFISYRRDDCAAHAGRLYDRLVDRLGADAVFMDIDGIEPGVDFGERIEQAVGSCKVLVALIGDDWLDIADSAGRRRLDDPSDLVRLEVSAGLGRADLRVIPVLVEGARMPTADVLPDNLKSLARRNAFELSDMRWRTDVERLITVVESVGAVAPARAAIPAAGRPAAATHAPQSSTGRPARLPRRRLAILAGTLAALAVAAIVLLASGDDRATVKPGRGPSERRSLTAETPIPIHVTRPNSLALSGDNLVVLSAGSGELVAVNARTGQAGSPVPVGRGGIGVASGFGSLWVAKFPTRSLLRVDPSTLNRAGAAIKRPEWGRLAAVATDERSVWIATHEDGGIDKVIGVQPRSGVPARTIEVSGGVQDLAVGDGAVWVTNRSRATVTRIPTGAAGRSQVIRVGRVPHGLAVGEGAVWVAASGEAAITRIDSRTLHVDSVPLDVAPERVAVGGGSVWVTSESAAQLIRIDPLRRSVRDTIHTGRQPYAVGVYRDSSVWFTLVGEDAIQRWRFAK